MSAGHAGHIDPANKNVALLIAGVLGNIITGVALIYLFGLVGAAIASTMTLIVWNVAMALFIWRRLNLLSGVLALFR